MQGPGHDALIPANVPGYPGHQKTYAVSANNSSREGLLVLAAAA